MFLSAAWRLVVDKALVQGQGGCISQLHPDCPVLASKSCRYSMLIQVSGIEAHPEM